MDCRGLRKSAGKDLQPSFTPQKQNHMNTEASEINSSHIPLHHKARHGNCQTQRHLRTLPFISVQLSQQSVQMYSFYALFSIILFLFLHMSSGRFSCMQTAQLGLGTVTHGSLVVHHRVFFTTLTSHISCTPPPIPTSFLFLSLSPPLFTSQL